LIIELFLAVFVDIVVDAGPVDVLFVFTGQADGMNVQGIEFWRFFRYKPPDGHFSDLEMIL
jgi:hypothetical protein